jgi:hypothetical protein
MEIHSVVSQQQADDSLRTVHQHGVVSIETENMMLITAPKAKP